MYSSETNIRVRYAETDQMGYVYYGNYATYYEVGRVEGLRALGFNYKDLEAQGIMMPVMESKSRYLLPARYDELLSVKTMIKEMPRAKVIFHYEIANERGDLLNIGETALIFMSMSSGKLCRCPSSLSELLAPYFEN